MSVFKTGIRHSQLFNFFLFGIMGLLFSCQPTGEQLNSLTGVASTTTVAGTPAPNIDLSRLRIVTVAGTTSVGAQVFALSDSISLRAVLVDSTGAILTEVDVQWWVSGSINADDLVPTGGNPTKYATFNADTAGVGLVHATIIDSSLITQYNIASNTTSTGTFNVATSLTADTINIVSGNNQTGQVGSTLSQSLKIQVLSTSLDPVPGKSVTFSVAAGGGTIVTAQPVVTDSNGEATCVVTLGGVVGTSNNTFTASMTGGSVSSLNFNASATPGPAYRVVYTTQPDGANVNSVFLTQPVLEVKDSYGNVVTSSTAMVTLARSAGTGAVGGTAAVNAVNGVVTFSNITYSVAENSVTIIATSPGLLSATSTAFNVGNVIDDAQCIATTGWITGEGGCRDMTNGLVWSATSAAIQTWHQAAWDTTYTPGNVAEAWEIALGLARDVVASPHTTANDGNITAYCHDLVESGYSDWRLPTVNEAYAAWVASADLALKNSNTTIWTGNMSNLAPALCTYLANAKCRINLSTGVIGTTLAATAQTVRCVRRPVPTKVIFYREPSAPNHGFGIHREFEIQPIVRIVDSQNMLDTSSTALVTLTAIDGAGSLLGTTSVNAVGGVATFTNLKYDTAETIRLVASSGALTTATTVNSFVINQQLPFALCKATASPAYFLNANGGCKDKTTGYIFSAPSYTTIANWYATVWNDVSLATADEDSYDNNRSDDESTVYPSGANPDNSATNYCHNLLESGYQDWMAAEYQALNSIVSKTPTTSVNFHSTALWTSATVQATQANAYQYTTANAMTNVAKTTATNRAICVRQDAPAQLVFSQQPAGGANGFGAGLTWATQPIVKIQDADGATMYGRSDTITLTVLKSDGTAATGNLFVGDTNFGNSVTKVAVNGVATFTGLNYDNANENIKLVASIAPITWKGNVVNIPDTNSSTFNIPTSYVPSLCQAGGNWASQNGGCQDLGAGGIVWSHVIGTYNWHQIMWDSVQGGADAPDAFDGVRIDHYDPAYPPLAGPDSDVTVDICHKLRLNGFKDWRVPTYAELDLAMKSTTRSGYTRIYKNGATYVWSGRTYNVDPTKGYIFTITTGIWYASNPYVKSTAQGAICVRDP